MVSPPSPPVRYRVEPERPRRRRGLIIAAVVAVLALAGAGAGFAVTRSGHRHHAVQPLSTASSTAAPSSAADPTCSQFLDAYRGAFDLGEPPNVWAGHVLADLIGADGIAMQLDGLTQLGFALDLNQACLDPSVFGTPARVVASAVYRANKSKYTHG